MNAIMSRGLHECPVCRYPDMPEPPSDYNICSCCGTEFGSSDEYQTHAQIRTRWINAGCKWFFREQPEGWNPQKQLTAYARKNNA